MMSVVIGAYLGSWFCISDRAFAEFPHWPIEGALLASTAANMISFWFY